MENNKKFVTGIRFVKGYDFEENKTINRIDVLLLEVLKEGPEDITTNPTRQFHYSFDPDCATLEQIAGSLRSLADKIEKET